MSNLWDNHPNAKCIDLVLTSIENNSRHWYAAWEETMSKDTDVSWQGAWMKVYNKSLKSEWLSVWDLLHDKSNKYGAAWMALGTLVICNDCSHMLSSDPDELRILSKLGVDTDTLMIPAAIAFKLINKQ